jgi:8-oxo-dGTP pyrophosphatase MutT (NUDIX family)
VSGADSSWATWDERVAAFWRDAGDRPADDLRTELEALLADRGEDDPEALFERASLHDYLGEEEAAIPVYRSALDGGLRQPLRTRAVIQLASSLRNVGDPSGAIAVLRDVDDDDELAPAALAFLSLALFDDGKPAAALRTTLTALAPFLPAYSRAVTAYADELAAPPRVRSIVVGLVIDGDQVLAEEYLGGNGGHFLRAPGGGIEFGESTMAALHREFREELDATIDEATLLGVTENIFDGHGKRGHEIVHVYAVRSAALEALPKSERLPVLDSHTTVGWFPLERIREGGLAFYPPGILDLSS